MSSRSAGGNNPSATAPFIFLVLLICLCSSSCTGSLQSGPTKCPGSSVAIPYPFNIPSNSSKLISPGFAISCESTGPMLLLGNKSYTVLNIALDQGYVRVTGDTVYSQCHNNDSNTQNKFTVVGCDSMATLRSPARGYIGGCVSFCASMDSSIISGACSGVGCCQASVPEKLTALDIELTSIRNQLPPFSGKAFIVDQSSYVFSRHDLERNLTNMPMVLDWSIKGASCEEARRAPRTFKCRDNTECYDVTNKTGYRCKCSKGFAGNPYLQGLDGCQDTDECKDENNYPCTHKCVNTDGDFYCKCPMGMTGDGKKGSGCKRDSMLVIAVASGGLPLLPFLLMLGFWTHWLVKKRKLAKIRQRYLLQNGGMLLKQQINQQLYDDNIAGRGGFGTVYRGILSDQMVVAIKKSQRVDQSQVEQFVNELVILSQVNHRHVVQLVGCCLESEVPLLVYEFITNGPLFHHLHNTSMPMPWEDRLRISLEIATALAYLHLAPKMPIIHRDVKSSNILLDKSFTAKVSDFGASRPMSYNQTHTTLVEGTLGYMDPEYFQTNQLTDKSDVYSFGVVLIELLTRSLVLHFSTLFHQNRWLEIVDRQVANEAGVRHVKTVVQLALRCLRCKGEDRPRMIEVAVELEALSRLMKQHSVISLEE
ncbi:hypothetical protein BRADI_3g27058v3 [Brachypodium distachyon]|uniref:Protein kinase domain-containing protein n=1 Tax=Brachypodium distachyon TaxID=15368 RepID=A0A2K2CZE9_BRADI|nr:hypothetical protein BRADI_3g27058v3 [Brachypodium distachyon]